MSRKQGLIAQLPEVKKTGWPWTEETDPSVFDKNKEYPKISIVTPSYNQGHFIEETIRSALLQNYPNLEFIIIDGGSTDNTVEIIKRYEPWISYWVSEKDRGQSHALNKGFKKATGELVGWQNSDDIYMKNAFHFLSQSYLKNNSFDVYFGHQAKLNTESKATHISYFVPFSLTHLKYYGWNITNQSSFFKNIIVKQFPINEQLHYTMDQDFYTRIALNNRKFKFINAILGGLRDYPETKSSTMPYETRFQEYQLIFEKYHKIKLNYNQSRFQQHPIKGTFIVVRYLLYSCFYLNIHKILMQKLKKLSVLIKISYFVC